MLFSKPFKTVCALSMAAFISQAPAVAFAEVNRMLPTTTLIEELNREEATSQVQEFLSRDDVQAALIQRGLSPAEASDRLASLSVAELNDLSKQVQEAKAGGAILVTILIVVLIIFLIKRI